jgi:hypothetical protein
MIRSHWESPERDGIVEVDADTDHPEVRIHELEPVPQVRVYRASSQHEFRRAIAAMRLTKVWEQEIPKEE